MCHFKNCTYFDWCFLKLKVSLYDNKHLFFNGDYKTGPKLSTFGFPKGEEL